MSCNMFVTNVCWAKFIQMQKYSFKYLNLRAKFHNQPEAHVVTADASSACLPRANKPNSSERWGSDWRGVTAAPFENLEMLLWHLTSTRKSSFEAPILLPGVIGVTRSDVLLWEDWTPGCWSPQQLEQQPDAFTIRSDWHGWDGKLLLAGTDTHSQWTSSYACGPTLENVNSLFLSFPTGSFLLLCYPASISRRVCGRAKRFHPVKRERFFFVPHRCCV